jgi:hypothetical protein
MLPPLRDDDDLPVALATGLTAAQPLMLEESMEERMRALKILEPDLRVQLMSINSGEREARLAALERMGERDLMVSVAYAAGKTAIMTKKTLKRRLD